MSTYNVFVTGRFNVGKTTMLSSTGWWLKAIRTDAYFRTTPSSELHACMDFASILVEQTVLTNLFTHSSTQSYLDLWEQVGAQIDGVIILLDPVVMQHRLAGSSVLRAARELLEYFREHAAGQYIIAANKIDLFKNYRDVLIGCRSVLGIRPDEVLIPSVATNPKSVRYTVARLIKHLERTQ